MSWTYDVDLERRYRELHDTPGTNRAALGERFDAIVAARYRRRGVARLTERESHELDNRLADLGLDQRGRPFFECPLQPGVRVVEEWEPSAGG